MEDTTTVSGADDVRVQGKEGDLSMENLIALEANERVIPIEGDMPRTSAQQFVDYLDGKDPVEVTSVVDAPQNSCTRYREVGEGRVQELKLGQTSSGFCMINEGETMGEVLDEWQHDQIPGSNPPTLSSLKDLRYENALAGQVADQIVHLNRGKSTYNGSDEILGDPLASGGMRMKIISRSSDHPEYFVKNTLKGKGIVCRGPNPTKIVQANPTPSTSPCSVDMEEKSSAPSADYIGAGELLESQEFVNNGVNLREWMKLGQSKLQKVDRLCVFKEILEVVSSLHSDGKVLVDLRPSQFRILASRKIRYCGRLCVAKEMNKSIMLREVSKSQSLKRPLDKGDSKNQVKSSRLQLCPSPQQHGFDVVDQMEEKWYRSPEELFGRGCTSSSNIYCLGVFLFELLSSFDSEKIHAATMSDLRHRILPPNFLLENPKEAGFGLWLLHPDPSLRPAARDILQAEVICGLQETRGVDDSSSFGQDKEDSELLLDFLKSMREQKEKNASKLVEDLGCIESDIKELEKRHLLEKSMSATDSQGDFLFESGGCSSGSEDKSDSRFSENVVQLESAYFSSRSQLQDLANVSVIRKDMDILKNRENFIANGMDKEQSIPIDDRGAFFDDLCKYARYSKLEVCGTLRNREITNSNVIFSLSFDRDEDYFAAAGVSKKIKIFDFQALCDDSVDIHYPMIEMPNNSKLTCVCWNSYIRNYLASTDYDGTVKLWDASTGQEFSQYFKHEKRAWSVDFSQLDPTQLVSGSDDCSVKLWSINEKNCLRNIRNVANVCCVQFSAHSSHLLAYGSADYKIYCYDLRNANVPWCVLAGHKKAVSYVKFINSATLVSASTDNTLKLWDLSKSNPGGLSNDACGLTLGGHTNEKNFVGLSVSDGYIACGSETNEVYTYYKSLPMPITSHQFGSIDPISGKETDDDNGQFVSSVCWKGKSNVVVAANSSGCIKVLKMV